MTLDVKNAFNTARWNVIADELRINWRVSEYLVENIKAYLSNRSVMADDQRFEVRMGVLQGSILGPILWNVLYDGLLRLQYPMGVDVLAYAEGTAALATEAVDQVCEWMREVGLEIAPHKTESVMLVGARAATDLRFSVMGGTVAPGASLKYLGVVFDAGGSFFPHMQHLATKAERQIMMMPRLMPKWSIMGQTKQTILAAIFTSTILYGAEAWCPAINIGRNKRLLVTA